MDIKELVDLCKEGDELALGLLYKTYSGKMMKICLHYVPDKQIAQDLLHDGFIVIFTSIDSLRTPEKLESWMGAIMKNISLRYLNQNSANTSISLSDIAEEEEPVDNPPLSDSIPYDKIAEMVEKLPEGYSKVFKLAILEGLSHKEIGKLLNIAPHSSSSQLFRAKGLLKKMISDYKQILILVILFLFPMIHDYLDWKRRDTKTNHWAKNVIRKSKIEKKPENENTISFIKNMKDKVNISLAHTNADYESAKAAFDAGANHAVHLFNAMPAFTHREPGVVGAVSDSEHVMAEIICDGVHIHPSMVRAAFKMMGADRMIFISDGMRATGMPDGQYTLGGLDVKVRGNRATLVSDGALAGSVTNLADCMRTAITKMGIPLETAIACATKNPAISLGIYDERGSISVGKKADILLLDKNLTLKTVIKDGVTI